MVGSRSSNAVIRNLSLSRLCSPLRLFHSQAVSSLLIAKMIPSSFRLPISQGTQKDGKRTPFSQEFQKKAHD